MSEVSTIYAGQEFSVENGAMPKPEMLAAEAVADGQLAELAAAVDEVYSGLEQELGKDSNRKRLNGDDDLGGRG